MSQQQGRRCFWDFDDGKGYQEVPEGLYLRMKFCFCGNRKPNPGPDPGLCDSCSKIWGKLFNKDPKP